MARTTSRVNKTARTKANTAAKRARLEEGGLRGPRLGRISSAKRRAQARRDTKSDAAAATTARKAAVAKSAAGGAAAAATKASPRSAAKKPAAAGAAAARAGAKARKRRTSPLVEVRTANSVKGSARLDAFAEKVVTGALSRFMPRLTRIDVHLSDTNAAREVGDDKRCQIEARPASQQPVSATAAARTIEQALTAAANKMKRLLAKRLDPRVRA